MPVSSTLGVLARTFVPPQRDDFSARTLDTLAKRVGFRCSNPVCGRPTAGPRSEADATVNIGVGAHISAAATGGPRFDPTMSAAQRRSAANGIWLCQVCAKLIDNDVTRYTACLLKDWKRQAEAAAIAQLERPPYHGTEAERVASRTERRKLVDSWRSAISNEKYDFIDYRSKFLSSATYSSLRPHLSLEVVRIIETPCTFYVGGVRGDNVRQYTLLDEVARLEREWGLL